ncbi:MAG: response regulator [Myxococcales bacterium]|nr:response regulator [Myxococcales bacterium]MCB9750530.1 response regulator [Myxococcales bacterium]
MGKKILIVEDNELSRDMLSRRLRRKGYEVITAEDGETGIVKAEANLPDVILMDLSLPKLDGWETTRRIKGMSQTQNIPVIALTAHAMSGDREKAIDAGCDDYDTKPVDLRRLLTKIQRFLADGAGNGPYYKVIDGVKYDKGMLDVVDVAVKGQGDGRISLGDARKLLAQIKDANKYTQIEKTTMAYIRDNYKFTDEADTWIRAEIRKWAASK